MNERYCDCCGHYNKIIYPYGSSFLCGKCLCKYQEELKNAPTIKITNFNTAKRKIAQLNQNPLVKLILLFKELKP